MSVNEKGRSWISLAAENVTKKLASNAIFIGFVIVQCKNGYKLPGFGTRSGYL